MILSMFLALAVAPDTVAATELSDSQCMAAFGYLANQSDPKQQEAGKIGTVYFTGKLFGRNPAIDLSLALKNGAQGIDARLQADLKRCSAELGVAGNAMMAAGNSLQTTAPKP